LLVNYSAGVALANWFISAGPPAAGLPDCGSYIGLGLVRALEAKLRSGSFTITEMRKCRGRQWEFARSLLQRPLAESFQRVWISH
jgi:hypothetical protein